MMVRHPRMGVVRMSRDRLTGDPGLWSFLGKIGKGLVKGLGGVVKSQLGISGVPATPGVPQIPIPSGPLPSKLPKGFKFPAGGLGEVPMRSVGPRHRRMRATNVKALRRALRRVHGFERIARKVLRISTGHPVRVRFRKRKRAA